MGIIEAFSKLLAESGFAALTWREIVMLIVSCVLLYLAIEKKFEPLLLLPIAFGMLLQTCPRRGLCMTQRSTAAHGTSPVSSE